jgi:hypothetical protein
MSHLKKLHYNTVWKKYVYLFEVSLSEFRELLDRYDEENDGSFGNPRLYCNTPHPIVGVLRVVGGIDIREIYPNSVYVTNEEKRLVEASMGEELSTLYMELSHFQLFEAEIYGRYDIHMTVDDVRRAVDQAEARIENSDYEWESWS